MKTFLILICLFFVSVAAADPNFPNLGEPNDFVGPVVDPNVMSADPNVGLMTQPGLVKLVPWFRVSVSADGALEITYGAGLTLSQVAQIFFYEHVKPLAEQYIQKRRQEIITEFSTRWNRFCMPINSAPDSNNLPASR